MEEKNRNPRVIVAFKPHEYETIKRLADLQDTSMAKVILQFFRQILPGLADTVAALEAAKEAKGKPAAQLIAAMSRLQSTVHGMAADAVDQVDMWSSDMGRSKSRLKAQSEGTVRPRKTTARTRKRGKRK